MKKLIQVSVASLMLGVSVVTTGCFGEFALTRKVYTWNQDLSDSKFVQTLVFYGLNIIPVYGIAGAVDFYILNLIEFWTGSNPAAMKDGQVEKQIVKAKDGNSYEIMATKNCFQVTQLTGSNKGQVQKMLFNPADNSSSIVVNGVESKLVKLNAGQNTVSLFKADGSSVTVNANSNTKLALEVYKNSNRVN